MGITTQKYKKNKIGKLKFMQLYLQDTLGWGVGGGGGGGGGGAVGGLVQYRVAKFT